MSPYDVASGREKPEKKADTNGAASPVDFAWKVHPETVKLEEHLSSKIELELDYLMNVSADLGAISNEEFRLRMVKVKAMKEILATMYER